MRPDAVQMGFPDRYSICILDTAHVCSLTDDELKHLVHRFYNDTYVLDQNACSSPVAVIWNQKSGSETAEHIRTRWWNMVAEEAGDYHMTAHKATVKYEQLCRYAMESQETVKVTRYGNRLYTIRLSCVPEHPDQLKGSFGLFFEYTGDWREAVGRMATSRLQTITYHGIKAQEIEEHVVANHLFGVHRIVPVGQAADMDLIWDGQDFITVLSRQIGRGVQDGSI